MTHIDEKVRNAFPGLFLLAFSAEIPEPVSLNTKPILDQIKEKYDLNTLTDHPIVQAFRAFFWAQKIDPTKERVSSEALVRRILSGKGLPNIHPVVDVYNLFSAKYLIPISGFDEKRISGDMLVRFAEHNEEFLEIGGKKELLLGREVVLSDETKILSIYAHKDSEYTKITEDTKNYVFVLYGVPGIEPDYVERLYQEFSDFLERNMSAKIMKSVLVD